MKGQKPSAPEIEKQDRENPENRTEKPENRDVTD